MTISLSRPAPIRGAGFRSVFVRLGDGVSKAIRAVQYARMCEAMGQMSDEQLAAINLTRADIPRHARHCVYADI